MSDFDVRVIRNEKREPEGLLVMGDGEVAKRLIFVLLDNNTMEEALDAAKKHRGRFPYGGAQWTVWQAVVHMVENAVEHGIPLKTLAVAEREP